jgi:hypothetical protein
MSCRLSLLNCFFPTVESRDQWVDQNQMVLYGHRSIVNQIRYNPQKCLLASSGVEKIIKVSVFHNNCESCVNNSLKTNYVNLPSCGLHSSSKAGPGAYRSRLTITCAKSLHMRNTFHWYIQTAKYTLFDYKRLYRAHV